MPSQAPTTQRPQAPRSRRWLLIAIAGLALAGAAAAAVVLAAQSDQPEETKKAEQPVQPAPAAAPTAPPEKPPAAPEEAKVVIRVEPEPADAVVTADGEPLSGGELVRPKSDATVEIAVSRDGYQPKTRTVSLAESRTVEVILEKTAAPSKHDTPAKKTGSKKKKPDGTDEKSDRIIDDSPYD
jgi:hypothetical protein